jgi:hypothetical protein
MLCGCQNIYVYTDQKTILLLTTKPNTLCWWLFLEDYAVTSKVNPIHLLTHFHVFPLMRGRTLPISTIIQEITVIQQAKKINVGRTCELTDKLHTHR